MGWSNCEIEILTAEFAWHNYSQCSHFRVELIVWIYRSRNIFDAVLLQESISGQSNFNYSKMEGGFVFFPSQFFLESNLGDRNWCVWYFLLIACNFGVIMIYPLANYCNQNLAGCSLLFYLLHMLSVPSYYRTSIWNLVEWTRRQTLLS